MANHKSSEKRARQSTRRNLHNSQIKSSIKTLEKKLLKAIETKAEDITTNLRHYVSLMMKSVSKGVINKKTAARKVSRLSKKIKK